MKACNDREGREGLRVSRERVCWHLCRREEGFSTWPFETWPAKVSRLLLALWDTLARSLVFSLAGTWGDGDDRDN